ncbi:MAG: hypothetical protein HRF50_01145 [Phycisphaerae bacterium]|jgi:hypothetical protein
MMLAVSPSLVALLFSAAGPIQVTPAVTVETLRAEHAAHAAAVHSLLVVEVVETHNPRTPTWEAQTRSYLERRAAAERARIAADAAELQVPDSERRLVTEQRMREQPTTDLAAEYMPVWWANENERTRRRVACDFAGQRLRLEQRDLRDLTQLRAQFGIVAEQDQNLDSTRTLIITAGYTLLLNRDDTMATVLRGGTSSFAERLELLGIIPARLLDGRFPVELSDNPDGSINARGALPDTGQVIFELTLRREPGHHMTHMVQYSRTGEVVADLELSDYRHVAPGVWAPFHAETSRRLGGSLGERTETHEVASLEVNPPLDGSTFEPPAGIGVVSMDPQASEAYKNRPGHAAGRD